MLEKSYLQKLQNTFIGNTNTLLNGSVDIEDQISKNIQHFLKTDFLVQKMGLNIDIRILTSQGRIIYPTYIGSVFLDSNQKKVNNTQKIAEKNFALLNEDLKVEITLHLDHGANLANIILTLYSIISFSIFLIFYKISYRRSYEHQNKQKKLIKNLKEDEIRREKIVKDLNKERKQLFENIRLLNSKYQNNKEKAKINEDEMFNEIINLEEQLNDYIELKNNKDEEINELRSTIEKYERRKGGRSKRNEFEFISRRFNALYKNVEMNRKALNGFLSLTEDQQIKVEEVIHQLDKDPDSVIVKRKVFSGKKHRSTCLEVLFAYNGRLYFRRLTNKVEIVIIGTKNSQQRDMEFLQSL